MEILFVTLVLFPILAIVIKRLVIDFWALSSDNSAERINRTCWAELTPTFSISAYFRDWPWTTYDAAIDYREKYRQVTSIDDLKY